MSESGNEITARTDADIALFADEVAARHVFTDYLQRKAPIRCAVTKPI